MFVLFATVLAGCLLNDKSIVDIPSAVSLSLGKKMGVSGKIDSPPPLSSSVEGEEEVLRCVDASSEKGEEESTCCTDAM
jgi:hypothetical protein